MSRAVKRLDDDRGFTIVELMVVSLVTTIALISVTAIVIGLLSNVSNQDLIAQVERDARPVLENLVVELRQADQPETIARSRAVQELEWNMIAFYSDRQVPHPEPEKYVYELINCTNGSDGGVCDLQETVYTPDTDSHPPDWKFLYGTIASQRIVLHGVVADPGITYGPLFQAVEWTGDPVTRSVISSCDSAIPAKICDAPLITVDLRVEYSDRLGFDPLLLHEEVRLRNASY